MAVLDIGYGAVDGTSPSGSGSPYTCVDAANPANGTGSLDVFEAWALINITGFNIGTFSGSGSTYNDRDYEIIGNVTAGSKQTFTGKTCDVVTGDYIGDYVDGGALERFDSGAVNFFYVLGNKFGAGDVTYTLLAGGSQCTYATGTGTGLSIPVFMNQYRQRWN